MITFEAIGTFHTDSKYPYEARRQATAEAANSAGEIHLRPGHDFEQALEDLEGFERIWIVYQFHHNPEWKPKVMPPRGPRTKRGVFATRAPYRPNAVGLSCVRLINIIGLRVIVEGHDLLEGTPILDIKPYLPYADAFPDSRVGWLEQIETERWHIIFNPLALKQIQWLKDEGVTQLKGFIIGQLQFDPLDHKRKRVEVHEKGFCLAYRTWRVVFSRESTTKQIQIISVHSGYAKLDLAEAADPHADKEVHRQFLKWEKT